MPGFRTKENNNIEMLLGGGGQPLASELMITMGMIDGVTKVDKFGQNIGITTLTTPDDIWEVGGTYIYDADGTAPIVSLISDNAGDLVDIKVQGLDVNGDLINQTITLNGINRVALTTPLWRVFRMSNEGVTDLIGTVYCYIGTGGVPVATDTRAIITPGHNQTLMSIYTIPNGKVGFLYRTEIGMQYAAGFFSGNEYARGSHKTRQYGKVFKTKKVTTLATGGDSNYIDKRSFPDVMSGLTDIKLTIDEVSSDMGVFGTFDIMLVAETQFSNSYLSSIGQNGY